MSSWPQGARRPGEYARGGKFGVAWRLPWHRSSTISTACGCQRQSGQQRHQQRIDRSTAAARFAGVGGFDADPHFGRAARGARVRLQWRDGGGRERVAAAAVAYEEVAIAGIEEWRGRGQIGNLIAELRFASRRIRCMPADAELDGVADLDDAGGELREWPTAVGGQGADPLCEIGEVRRSRMRGDVHAPIYPPLVDPEL